MYFKPRIFISSTLDLAPIRKEIKEFLESVGAEVMLYEENLTPSISNSSYRNDILEADFIIFIFNDKYGSKTDSGKSGTHEEWEIALASDIPKHVYVKQRSTTENDQLQRFIKKEIAGRFISYYYYKDTKFLLSQIQSTVFTIANDIALNKIDIKYVPKEKIIELTTKKDFETGLYFIRIFEELKKESKRLNISFLETDILSEFMTPFILSYSKDPDTIIDMMLNEKYRHLMNDFDKFIELHGKAFTSSGGNTSIIRLTNSGTQIGYRELKKGENVELKRITKSLNEFLKSYDWFKDAIFERKAAMEIRYDL